jgi:hypothetical protein
MIDAKRIVDGVAWRAEALEGRLPSGVRVWLDNQRSNRRVRQGRTSFDRARLVRSYREAIGILLRREPASTLGDYLEFGVYHGTSLSCMHEAREALGLGHMRLVGFDSFEGLPESAATEDGGVWMPGQFKSTLPLTRENLRRWGVPDDAATLVPGWFSASCTPATRRRLGLAKASVIMVDCDLYSSTRDALAFCAPLIHEQAVIVFDDYHASGLADRHMGERRAFDEFLAAHPDLHARTLPGLNYKDKVDPEIFLVTRNAPCAT